MKFMYMYNISSSLAIIKIIFLKNKLFSSYFLTVAWYLHYIQPVLPAIHVDAVIRCHWFHWDWDPNLDAGPEIRKNYSYPHSVT